MTIKFKSEGDGRRKEVDFIDEGTTLSSINKAIDIAAKANSMPDEKSYDFIKVRRSLSHETPFLLTCTVIYYKTLKGEHRL